MEKKMKVIFFGEDNNDFAHVILTESQIRLLNYLSEKDCLFEGFTYVVNYNDVEWEEI